MTTPASTATDTTDVYPTRLSAPTPPVDRIDPVVWGGSSGPLDPATVRSYDERGYLTIDQLITPGELDSFRAELEKKAGLVFSGEGTKVMGGATPNTYDGLTRIFGGLVISQILTLFSTPVIYLALDRVIAAGEAADREACALWDGR